MLDAIIRFSLRFRGIVYALAVLLVGYGVYTLSRARLDVFPEFAPPMTMVHTEAPGLSSEQVETLVTQPIENALGGITGLRSMRSHSLQGLSMVTLVFGDDADVWQVRQRVSERLGAVRTTLPAGTGPPRVLPLTTATNVARIIGLTNASGRVADVREFAEWTLRPQLLNVPGVADAIVFGGSPRQLQIQVDPARLTRHGLAMAEVVAAARQATGVRGAGFIENANQRITLQAETPATTPATVGATVLRWHDGAAVRLRDVARVTYASAPAVGAASINGDPGIMMVIESQYGSNTLEVTRDIEARLEALAPAFAQQGVTLYSDVFNPAGFIHSSLEHLRLALLVGAVLVVAVLFLFLLNVRSALISAVAIPISLLAAVIALSAFGVTLNTMTLGGLAIALGEVVDDAIIDVENIHRRLLQNRALAEPRSAFAVVLTASLEVRSAVVFATFIVILIFLPVLGLSGVAGRLFAPLGIAYILAVLASLAVALTLTPAMALALLAKETAARDEPAFPRWLKRHYRAVLARLERAPRTVMTASVLLTLAALATLPFLSGSYIPQLHEGHYIAHVGVAPGTSLAESMRVGRQISTALLAVPGVRLVGQRAGRADEMVDPVGVQLSEIEVELEPMDGEGQERTLQGIRRALADFPGVTASVNTFLVERIDETISGAPAPVVIQVFGDNLDIIDAKAQEIAQVVAAIDGAAGVRVDSQPGMPALSIRLDPAALNRWGFAPGQVLDAIHDAYQGATVGQIHDGNRSRDVVVVLAPEDRERVAQLAELPLRSPDGLMVPLARLATVRQVAGRYQISHDGGRRMQMVSVVLGDRPVSDFVRDARERVAREVKMPPGTYAIFSGENEARGRAQRDLLLHGAMAGVGIAMLLFLALQSRRGVALVMANLPFALVGGVVSVAGAGGDLSLGAMVGFVTLFGISLRNSIMLVSHFEHLVYVEKLPWGLDTAVRGASERLIPILMTALVTGLALLPLALTSGAPGNEIEGPMAIVILGGLFSSTALNLLVLPTMALRFGRFG
ncbi:efflux RND transporter permease subunit [Nitrogeniibacter mangrovi]|uniref:Efflux RND transporter permease subunit n=1 Tax=Nitrogeniibacter mangrovi TaxID=2016596 RepID=A0A6C1AYF8_9RHOO|nr:efflux RND transporter permease subunit [Nitrogeniibacter mangrovi]QID16153.1 efflux RND transporter permease subunit [Nitrogeniibacter mangrovi]